MQVRKFVVTCEDVLAEQGRTTGRTVRRAVCSAVIANPLAGKPGADLTSLEALGAEISGELATRALA
ncbi:MAG: Amino acid synthesis, partial [Actinomycetota bacterium]